MHSTNRALERRFLKTIPRLAVVHIKMEGVGEFDLHFMMEAMSPAFLKGRSPKETNRALDGMLIGADKRTRTRVTKLQ